MAKSVCCSYGGHEFNSQLSTQQLTVTYNSISRGLIPSSDLLGYMYSHTHSDTYTQKCLNKAYQELKKKKIKPFSISNGAMMATQVGQSGKEVAEIL